jgi:ribosomal protein S18 acetylase RimI-like enzyme
VPDLEPLIRFWQALDARFAMVEPTWWGAVVSDPRFPAIWDVNYARVEVDDPGLGLADVEAASFPVLRANRARNAHTVVFHPEQVTGLLTEASTRGDELSWDTVMELAGDPPDVPAPVDVREVKVFDDRFWIRYRESLPEFDITDPEAIEQLVDLERTVLLPAGKRWFEIRDDTDRAVAYGSLVPLEGVGYVDHIVTFADARRRGYASAITRRIVQESRAMGQDRVYLLVERGSAARLVYERLGFVQVAEWASTLGPIARAGRP